MIVEIGHFSLILALAVALMQAITGLWRPAGLPAAHATKRTAGALCALIALSYTALTYAYVVSDFSVANVVANSHSYKPLLYKISGVWGNHEGAMLLWVFVLSAFGWLVSRSKKTYATPDFYAAVQGVQGLLAIGFISFILFTSNPFARLLIAPADGQGLTPILQDPALAIHPPLLYGGYVGFSIAFSFAVAALLTRIPQQQWTPQIKPWVLLAWTSLSAGIALGSFWAYYELGWGGWWFWDPVENSSLLPWLLGTALLHSLSVLEKRGVLWRWTILLAILTFSTAILGTFLVRSGVLTSVHAFARDPGRGLYILALFSLYTGGALSLFAWRAVQDDESRPASFTPISRESGLLINNLLLSTMTATILTGTLYPLFAMTVLGKSLSVGPPYFNTTVLPLAVPLLAIMGVGPFLGWKKADPRKVFKRLQSAAIITLFALLAIFLTAPEKTGSALLGLGLAVWLITATAAHGTETAGLSRKSDMSLLARLKPLPFWQWGLLLSHAGLGIAVIGMVSTGLWSVEKTALLQQGEQITLGRYELQLEKVAPDFGPNYSAIRATMAIKDGRKTYTLSPETRYYAVARQKTTETSIRTSLTRDIYVTLGDEDRESGGWVVTARTHPGIPFLWTGFIFIIIGGAMSTLGAFQHKERKT